MALVRVTYILASGGSPDYESSIGIKDQAGGGETGARQEARRESQESEVRIGTERV